MATWIWVLIPLAAIFAGVVKRWIDLQQARLDRFSRNAVDLADRQAEQVERLEQRVRILERIVTDRGHDLATEIERLRDRESGPPATGEERQ